MHHPYEGATASLATKHGKAVQIAPAFAKLKVGIETIEIDTDRFGTFGPEVARELSQRDTVIAKARAGMAASGARYGIASEATIGADPLVPFLNSTIEAIAWVDGELGFELVEFHRSLEIIVVREEIAEGSDLDALLLRADFPNHGLIVYKPGGEIRKGIRDRGELERALIQVGDGAIVESDLRAHMSPSRQLAIAECAAKLVARLGRLCPGCNAPGFGAIAALRGLSCESCGGEVVSAVRGELFGCVRCDTREERGNGVSVAPARECSYCNP